MAGWWLLYCPQTLQVLQQNKHICVATWSHRAAAHTITLSCTIIGKCLCKHAQQSITSHHTWCLPPEALSCPCCGLLCSPLALSQARRACQRQCLKLPLGLPGTSTVEERRIITFTASITACAGVSCMKSVGAHLRVVAAWGHAVLGWLLVICCADLAAC